MSQHLIDTGQRVSTDRETHTNRLREAGKEGDGQPHRNGFGGNGNGHSAESERRGDAKGDATLSALDALAHALGEMSHDRELLETRLRELHRQRSEGRPWRDILAEEEPPGTMQVVSRMLAVLAKASGTLRKELVDTLRSEGVSIPSIAKLFGVTHQRVSNLLRRPSD